MERCYALVFGCQSRCPSPCPQRRAWVFFPRVTNARAQSTEQGISLLILRKVARNSVFSSARYLLAAVLVFLITPYVVNKLGTERFAIWALAGVLTTYVRLGDFGISRALVKYVAELDARGDTLGIKALVNTTLVLYTMVGLSFGLVFAAIHEVVLVQVFRVPYELQAEARRVFTGVLFVAMADLVLSTFRSVLEGLQEIHTTSTIESIRNLFSVVGVVIALELGYGLMGLVVKNAVLTILSGIGYWFLAQRALGELKIGLCSFKQRWARKLLGFGSHVQVVNIVSLLVEPLNKALISSFSGLYYVTYYEIAIRVVNQAVAVFQALALALYPATAEVEVREGRGAVTWMYARSTRYITLTALPVFMLLAVLAPGLIRVWLGPEYDLAGASLQLLSLGWLIAMPSVAAYLTALGVGQPRLSMLASVITAVGSALLGFLLLKTTGYVGLIAGNTIGSVLGSLSMFLLFHTSLGIPYTVLRRAVFNRALLITVVLGLSLYVATTHVGTWTFALLFGFAAAYTVLYGCGILFLGYVDVHDRIIVRKLLPSSVGTWIIRTPE